MSNPKTPFQAQNRPGPWQLARRSALTAALATVFLPATGFAATRPEPVSAAPLATASLRGSFDVTDPPYGAKGDGVTDDRAALQAAINAANAAYLATGAVQDVIIPYGIFSVGAVNYVRDNGVIYGATSLKLLNGVNITGSGTVRVPNNSYGSGAYYRVFSSPDGSGSGVRLSNGSISGITIDGNKANQISSKQCSNIELDCAANVTVANVRSINANGNGIMLRGTTTTNATNLRILDCTVLNASCIGIQSAQFDGLIINSNYIDTTADNCIDIYGEDGSTTSHARNFVISNNICKNSGLVGIFPETVRDGTITGNTISGCAAAGIHVNRINGAPRAITISGNTVSACPISMFVSGDTNGINITSNTFRDFARTGVQLGTSGGNVSRAIITQNVFDPPNQTTYLITVTGRQAAFIKSLRNIVVSGAAAYFLKNTATVSPGSLFEAPINTDS